MFRHDENFLCGNAQRRNEKDIDYTPAKVIRSSIKGRNEFKEEQNKKYGNCMTSCEGWALNEEDTPIGETLILIPFALAYAVIRRRKEETL